MNILVKTSIPCNCLVFVAGTAAVAVFTALRRVLYSPPLLSLSLSLARFCFDAFVLTEKALNEEVVAEQPTMSHDESKKLRPRRRRRRSHSKAFNIIKYLLGDSEFPSKP